MTNHPMLAMRDPAPILDVTRPAVPPLTPAERALIVDALERLAKVITESAAQTVKDEVGDSGLTGSGFVAADQVQPGDRVMWKWKDGGVFWHPNTRVNPASRVASERHYRRPTAAELALHWPEVLP